MVRSSTQARTVREDREARRMRSESRHFHLTFFGRSGVFKHHVNDTTPQAAAMAASWWVDPGLVSGGSVFLVEGVATRLMAVR